MKKVKYVIFRLLCVTNILLTYHAAAHASRRSGQCPSECSNCVSPTIRLCGASHIRGPQGLIGLRGLPSAFLKAYLSAHGIGINNLLASHNLNRPGGIGILQSGSLFGPSGIRFHPGEFGLHGFRPGGAIQGGFGPGHFRLPGSFSIGPGGVMYGNRPGVDGIPHGNIEFGPGGIINVGYGPRLEGIPHGNRPRGYGLDVESIIQGNPDNIPGGIIQGEIDPEAKGITGINSGETIPGSITQGDIGIRPESILQEMIASGVKGITGISPGDPIQGGISQGDTGIGPEGILNGMIVPGAKEPNGISPENTIQGGIPQGHTGIGLEGILNGIGPGAKGISGISPGDSLQGDIGPADNIQGIIGPGTGKDISPLSGIVQENTGIQPGGDMSAGIGPEGIDPAQENIGIIPDRILQGGIVPGAGGIVPGNTGGSGVIGIGSGGNAGNVPGDIHFGGPNNGNYGSGVINSGIYGSGTIAPGGGGHSGSTFMKGFGPSGFATGGVGIEGNGIKEMETGDIGPEGIVLGNMGTDFTGQGAIRVKDNGANSYGTNGFTNYASGTIPTGSSHYKQKNKKIMFNYDSKVKNDPARSHNPQGPNSYVKHYTYNGNNPDIEELSNLKSNVYSSDASHYKNDNNETGSIGTDNHDTDLPIAREREPVTTSRANTQIETDKGPLNNAVTDTGNTYTVALQLDEGNKLQPIIFNENEMNSNIAGNNSFIQGQTIQQPLQGFYPVNVQNLRDNPAVQETIFNGKDALGKRTLVKVFHFKGNDLTGGKVYDFKDGLKDGKIYHINGKDVNGSSILYDGENITDFLFGDPLFGERGLGIHRVHFNNLIKDFQRENRNITDQESTNLGDTSKKFPLREGGMVIKEYHVGPDGVSNKGSEGKVTDMIQQYLNGKKLEGLRMGNRSQEQSTEEVNENENEISIRKTNLDEQSDIVGLQGLSGKIGAIKEGDLSVEDQTKGTTKTFGVLDTVKDKGINEGEATAGEGSTSEEAGINSVASNGEGPSIAVEAEAGSDEGVDKGIETKHGGSISGVGFRERGRIELDGGRELGTTEEAVLGYAGGASGHGVGKGEGDETDSEVNGNMRIFGIGFRSRAKGVTSKGEDFGEGAGSLGGGVIRKGHENGHMGVYGFGFRGSSGINGRIKKSGASSLSEGIDLNKGLFLRKRGSHHKNRRNRHNSNGRRSHNRKTGYSRF